MTLPTIPNVPGIGVQKLNFEPGSQSQQVPPAPPITQGYNVPPAPPIGASTGDGVGRADIQSFRMFLKARAYVFGYVIKNAPYVQMCMTPVKGSNGEEIYTIKARESKPSKPEALFLSFPECAVTRSTQLADPMDIIKGNTNYRGTHSDATPLTMMFPFNAAISYIRAMSPEGSPRIAEYAPHVTGASQQWSTEEILRGKEGVSFVEVRSIKSTRNNTTKYNYSLKTTRKGYSIYTRHNILPLNAYKTRSVTIKNDQDAYDVNEVAFGYLRYRQMGSGTKAQVGTNKLKVCCSQMNTTLWEKSYTLKNADGKEDTVTGIGSCFFMHGKEDVNDAGAKILKEQCVYLPWDKPSKSQDFAEVTRIVDRTLKVSEKGTKRMQTERVSFDLSAPEFREYAKFAQKVIDVYATLDDIKALSARRKSGTTEKDESQMEYLGDFIEQNKNMIDELISVYARERGIKDFS